MGKCGQEKACGGGPCEDPREGTSRKREEPVPRSYAENLGVFDEAGS